MVVAVIVCLVIVQQIDCNILCPKIVGDIVGLHPALVLIAVTIGGNMNGLLGMIIAVPIAASLKTLIADWFATYMKADYDKHKKEANDIVSDDDPIFETLKRKNSKAQKAVVVNEDNEAVATVEDNTDNK